MIAGLCFLVVVVGILLFWGYWGVSFCVLVGAILGLMRLNRYFGAMCDTRYYAVERRAFYAYHIE